GATYQASSSWRFALARYDLDGSLDTTFGDGGKVITQLNAGNGSGAARSVAIQTDGKIVTGGTAYVGPLQSDHEFALARHDTAGNLDPTFGQGGLVTASHPGDDYGWALALQPDGKIVMAGRSGDYNIGTSYDISVARFQNDGSLDSSFGTGGF